MQRARENREPMTREEVRIMVTEPEDWVATAAAADRVAGVFITPPPLPTPRPPQHPAYQPCAQGGRPPVPTPQPARGGVCHNCYQRGNQKAACPYAATPPQGGYTARGGRGAGYSQDARRQGGIRSSHRCRLHPNLTLSFTRSLNHHCIQAQPCLPLEGFSVRTVEECITLQPSVRVHLQPRQKRRSYLRCRSQL